MFLNIDQKNPADIAAIDDHEDSLTYGELVRFCDHFGEVLSKRTLIFILSENCIGAFAGYIGALSNKIVPLIIHSHTESGLFQNLLSAYRPEYLWLPEHLGHEYESEVVFGFKHYILVKTGMTPPPLYKELSLLLPTSGSTGSSKLVRHSYKNVEANARNVSLLFGLDKHERALAALPIYFCADNQLRRGCPLYFTWSRFSLNQSPITVSPKCPKGGLPRSCKRPAQSRTDAMASASSGTVISVGLYCVVFLEIMMPSCRAIVETSIECVRRVRMKSLLSRGNTCVLSCSLRNAALETIRL